MKETLANKMIKLFPKNAQNIKVRPYYILAVQKFVKEIELANLKTANSSLRFK
jgi:hypothetical protein